jgi:hypothetical protein
VKITIISCTAPATIKRKARCVYKVKVGRKTVGVYWYKGAALKVAKAHLPQIEFKRCIC